MRYGKVITTIFILWLVPMTLLGQPEPKPRGEGVRLLEDLKLNDDQKKEMEKLRTELMKQGVAQHAKIATSRIELQELFRADDPDKAKIEKKLGEISQLENQGKMLRLNHWFSVNKLLTPDQQKVWKRSLMARGMQQHGGMMMGRRMGHRGFGHDRPGPLR